MQGPFQELKGQDLALVEEFKPIC